MKFKILNLCSCIVFAIVSFNAKGQAEMHDEKLKTNAKTVSISFYNGEATPEKKAEWTSIQYYDNNGRITSYLHFRKSGRLEYKDTYIYDKSGHLMENRNEEGGHLLSKMLNKYDSFGKLIESTTLNQDSLPNGKLIYKRNEKGRLIETEMYDEANNLVSKSVIKADFKDNITEEKVFDERNQLVRIWQTKYDKKSNIISSIEFGPDGKITAKNTHSYIYYSNGGIRIDVYYEKGIINTKQTFDKYGNIVESIMYGEKGGKDILSKEINKYKIDSKGNWIQKIDYENGSVFTTEIRKFGY